jgi:hypothetical protein
MVATSLRCMPLNGFTPCSVAKSSRTGKEAKRLAQAMMHVEAVLKMLEPGYDVRPIAVRRRRPNKWFKRGTVFRHALDVLRAAEGPLTTREINAPTDMEILRVLSRDTLLTAKDIAALKLASARWKEQPNKVSSRGRDLQR